MIPATEIVSEHHESGSVIRIRFDDGATIWIRAQDAGPINAAIRQPGTVFGWEDLAGTRWHVLSDSEILTFSNVLAGAFCVDAIDLLRELLQVTRGELV